MTNDNLPDDVVAEAVHTFKVAYLQHVSAQSRATAAAKLLLDDLIKAVGTGSRRGRARTRAELAAAVGVSHPSFVEDLARRLMNFSVYYLASNIGPVQVSVRGPTASGRKDGERGLLYLTVDVLPRTLALPIFSRPEPAEQARVFLCYASEDRTVIRELREQLTAAGFDIWIDEKDLLPGQDWELEIQRAIRGSDVVLACLSRRSVEKRGFVQRELLHALTVAEEQPEGKIFLIPVKLEPCAVPARLARWQWVAVYEPGATERLIRAIRVSRGEREAGP